MVKSCPAEPNRSSHYLEKNIGLSDPPEDWIPSQSPPIQSMNLAGRHQRADSSKPGAAPSAKTKINSPAGVSGFVGSVATYYVHSAEQCGIQLYKYYQYGPEYKLMEGRGVQIPQLGRWNFEEGCTRLSLSVKSLNLQQEYQATRHLMVTIQTHKHLDSPNEKR